MSKIKVGIIGVGSCAKSLVEGIQYYNENPQDKIGLMYEDIGGYSVHDIKFVVGFDIDKRKVNKKLAKALRAKPNCAMDHVDDITTKSNSSCVSDDAVVYSAPEMDGIAPHMNDYPDEVTFVNGAIPAESFDIKICILFMLSIILIKADLPKLRIAVTLPETLWLILSSSKESASKSLYLIKISFTSLDLVNWFENGSRPWSLRSLIFSFLFSIYSFSVLIKNFLF